MTLKNILEADEQCSFWRNNGKCDEKELFSDRIKISYKRNFYDKN